MIKSENISYRVAGKNLVSSLNLSVSGGEVVALLGPNGAGKSTLLKLLCGQITPQSGRVLFDGRPLSQWPPRALARQRAVLPQGSTVPFDFTVREIVLLGRSPHGDAASSANRAHRVMERTECAHLADRIVTTLSGGEMQRVQLARVLLQIDRSENSFSRCLMLDEPISNLDPAHQHGALLVARELAREGVGILVVLHDLNLAAQYADRLVLMKAGKLMAEGTPDKVLTEERIGAIFDVRATVTRNPVCDAPAVFIRR